MAIDRSNVHRSKRTPAKDRSAVKPDTNPIDSADPTGAATGDPTGAESIVRGRDRSANPDNRYATRAAPTESEGTEKTISVEPQEVVKGRRGRKPASQPARASKAKSIEESKLAAQGVIEMVEIFAKARFGEDAALTLTERVLIEQPLTNVIQRYAAITDRFSGLIDPIMIAAGAIMYSARLASLAKPSDNDRPGNQPKPPAAPETPKPSNGVPLPTASPDVFNMVGSLSNR